MLRKQQGVQIPVKSNTYYVVQRTTYAVHHTANSNIDTFFSRDTHFTRQFATQKYAKKQQKKQQCDDPITDTHVKHISCFRNFPFRFGFDVKRPQMQLSI